MIAGVSDGNDMIAGVSDSININAMHAGNCMSGQVSALSMKRKLKVSVFVGHDCP